MMSKIEKLERENALLKELLQSVLDFGKLAYFQKKRLWKAGFRVKFPKEYKWMKIHKTEVKNANQ